MRLPVILTALLAGTIMATPAAATPITYSFTGIMSLGSSLTNADGTITDLSLAPFTVTGMTGGVDPRLELKEYMTTMSAFTATSTYDFGALGSFTTDAGGDQYVEHYTDSLTDRSVTTVGLEAWWPGTIDLIGFAVGINPVSVADTTGPTPLGVIDPLYTLSNSHTRFMTNSAGDTFRLQRPTFALSLEITGGQVTSVPEPSSLTLLTFGALMIVGLAWRQMH